MSRFRNCGLAFVVLVTAACQKSATEERNDAVEAQREATETAQQAANDRQREVAEANKEAAQDISEARREARERSLEAVEDEIQRTSGAQAKANDQYNEAAHTGTGDRSEFVKDTNERLNKLEKESRDLHQEFNKNPKDMAADARTRLTNVDRELQAIRADVSKVATGTPEANASWKANIEKRLDVAEKTLGDID